MAADIIPLIQYIQQTFPIATDKAEEIAGRFTEKEVAKNDYLLVEGKVCKEFCFLETGFVWSSTFDINKNNITTNFYSGRQVVCELFSFFKQIPSKENFQALTDCRIWYYGTPHCSDRKEVLLRETLTHNNQKAFTAFLLFWVADYQAATAA